jgi:ABC-type multidrug transport system ATPase subunit
MSAKTAPPAADASPSGLTPATAAVALVGVRKVFRNDVLKKPQVAVDRLTLYVARGQVTGLLGHNGAGKTTTIRMLLGLIRPDVGEVLFGGAPLTTASKRAIGYMPEVNKLPAALTAEEILTQHLRLYRPADENGATPTRASRRARVGAALEAVGLTAHRKKRIGRMSKGMARRVAWAQATIHRPTLLILDEPTSGLDPLGRRLLSELIEAEKAKGTTILLCTHDLLHVSTLCEHFHVLRQGRLGLTTMPELAGAAQGAELYRGAQRFAVHLEVQRPAALDALSARGLPAPRGRAQRGEATTLTFATREAALAWVAAAADAGSGVTLTRFAADELGDLDLERFYKGS